MFRLLNPKAEVRATAGREFHMRSLEVMCLYVVNSIFLDGYLNSRGSMRRKTYQMLLDAGFEIESEYPLEDLLEKAEESGTPQESASAEGNGCSARIKTAAELRPARVG